jgi:hypothetical protein
LPIDRERGKGVEPDILIKKTGIKWSSWAPRYALTEEAR